MPTPIGHALAGVLTSWVVDLIRPSRPADSIPAGRTGSMRAGWRLALTCAVLAALPDIDLLFKGHRTITHSIGAVMIVGAAAAVLAARAGRPVGRITLMCASAYASHAFLDWLAVDWTMPRGVQALWPFDRHWYISGWDLFGPTERRHVFTAAAIRRNASAVARELVMLAPLLVIAWSVRRRRQSATGDARDRSTTTRDPTSVSSAIRS
jgi:membrane-bound metal-dependent hydrolase YbcI (DUF457 family)